MFGASRLISGHLPQVVYGCTELLNAEAFLSLLSPLAAA